jgi:hypothetical protein
MSAKTTDGEWIARPDPHSNPDDHPHGDYVVGVGDKIDAIATCTTPLHAALIAQAGNAYKSTGLTPRQLAEQLAEAKSHRDQLHSRLSESSAILNRIRDAMGGGPYDTIDKRITKAVEQLAELVAALEGMLSMFHVTQNPADYPADAPCNRAIAALAKVRGQ